MTILYRTPNIRIDEHEWHATVETRRGGPPKRHFRWRTPGRMWQPVADFKGHPPKAAVMAKRFQPFKRHMLWAVTGMPENSQK